MVLAIDVLMETLEAHGVDHIFGVPGASVTGIYRAAARRVRHVLAKHEEGAAFMAAGYARARRTLGVCVVTTGPGGTNAMTGIACARADSDPVLLLTGQSALTTCGKGALQESSPFGVDLVRMFAPITKLSAMVPCADRMGELVEHAIRTALAGRPGPVHLSIPSNILADETTFGVRAPSRAVARPVDLEAVGEAARILAMAEAPCILAGHGVEVSGAHAELLDLAIRRGIPVATTPKGKGAFPESHPLSLGVLGFGGHPRAEQYLLRSNVDVLLVVGSSLGEFATGGWPLGLQPQRALIHVDIDPSEIGRNYRTDCAIVGDAKATLRELGARLVSAADASPPARALPPAIAELPSRIDSEWRGAPDAPMKPQRLAEELREALPDDGVLVVDNGSCILWAGHYFEVRQPGTFFSTLGLASMGNAVAGVVGVKLAAPERAVVALVGDAAFAMNGMEVHTAVEYGLAVVWVVLNNRGHGMVRHGDAMRFGEHVGEGEFRSRLDVAGLARSLGARAALVTTPDELRAALKEALATEGVPYVIDAHVDEDEVSTLLSSRIRTLTRGVPSLPPAMPDPSEPA